MLYILFSIVVLLPVFAGWGQVFRKVAGDFFSGIAAQLFSGIFAVSLVWTVIAFFFPLDLKVELITIIIGLVGFFYYKIYNQFWSFFRETSLSFFVVLLITIFFGSYYPFILDHFGYYLPTIKWLSEFGLVQGISNLDLTLGQMSVWHLLQAGFSNFSDPFLRLNTVLLIFYLIYIFEKKSWIHLVFLPVLFLFSQSPSPDLPVIALSLILLNEILNSNKNAVLLFAFSAFVFFIKPTMIWLPIAVFLYALMVLKSKITFIIPGILILLLMMFKNSWVFGFPVFPVQFPDFGISWKPNSVLLANSAEMALLKTFDMQYSYQQIQTFSSFDFVKNWLFLKGIKGIIHQFFVLSLLALMIFAIRKNSKIVWIIFFSLIMKSVVVLMFSAQYRFFLDVFFVVFFVILFYWFSKKNSLRIFFVFSGIIGVFLSFPNVTKTVFPSFTLGNFMTGFSENQWFKPSYFELKNHKTYQIGNLKFNVVQQYPFSFDTPLPAISPYFLQKDLEAGIFPQMKGETLKEGFVWRKMNEEEKIQLQKIISSFPPEYFR